MRRTKKGTFLPLKEYNHGGICVESSCTKVLDSHSARGMCGTHYAQWAWKNLSDRQERNVWVQMLQRCNNPKNKSYGRYGGRGIKVCERWQESFKAFYIDMGRRPTPSHSIERIDNNGDYKPTNCKWATAIEQANNRRMRSNNTSGLVGITLRTSGRWQAKYRGKSLGYFDTKEAGHNAYLNAKNGQTA